MENADDKLIKTLESLEQLEEDIASIKEVEESFDSRLAELSDQVESLHTRLGEYNRQLDALSSWVEKIESFASKFAAVSALLDQTMNTLTKETLEATGQKLDEVKGACEEVVSKLNEASETKEKEKEVKTVGKGIKYDPKKRSGAKGQGKKKK